MGKGSWLLCLAIAMARPTSACEEGVAADSLRARFEHLLANEDGQPADLVGARIAALGPEAVPLVLEGLAHTPHRGELRAAVRVLGKDILPSPDPATPGAAVPPPATVLAVLAETGDAGDLDWALAQIGADLHVIEALSEILARDSNAWTTLRRLTLDAAPEVAALCLRAAGREGSETALSWLGEISSFELGLDLVVLSQIEAVARDADPEVDENVRLYVQGMLDSDEEQVRKKAVLVAVALKDRSASERLVELLATEDERQHESIFWALRRLTGLALPDDADRWRAWLENERLWFSHRVPILMRELQGRDRGGVIQAIRELAQHRLHASEIVAAIAPLLDHEDPEVRRSTCQALARIGSRAAAQALAHALEDEVERVSQTARVALGQPR